MERYPPATLLLYPMRKLVAERFSFITYVRDGGQQGTGGAVQYNAHAQGQNPAEFDLLRTQLYAAFCSGVERKALHALPYLFDP